MHHTRLSTLRNPLSIIHAVISRTSDTFVEC